MNQCSENEEGPNSFIKLIKTLFRTLLKGEYSYNVHTYNSMEGHGMSG